MAALARTIWATIIFPQPFTPTYLPHTVLQRHSLCAISSRKMVMQLVFTSFYFWFLLVTALFAHASSVEKPFSCTGYVTRTSSNANANSHSGSIYFNAHPADGLLYQNPNLLHDIYVFKCVTTIVMTSGNRGSDSNFSRSLERGIQESYALMANLRIDNPAMQETMVRVGTHDLHSWSLRGMRNIQIIYLRLPDGAPSGHGYDATGSASLSKLYYKEIDSITTTDGNATYTLRDIKELIAFILYDRKPNVVHILNHQAKLFDAHSASSDHADHIVSAKLVRGVVAAEKINATVKSSVDLYAVSLFYTDHRAGTPPAMSGGSRQTSTLRITISRRSLLPYSSTLSTTITWYVW